MARRYYIDTSAYLCILLGEAAGTALSRELRGGQLLGSTLLVLETTRNLVRLSREGMLAPSALNACLDQVDLDLLQFQLRDLTFDLCRGRTLPAVSTPRTLDLAHLRTALWFHAQEPLTRFVSLDAAQREAARELGLPA
jgi:hypothetical protein